MNAARQIVLVLALVCISFAAPVDVFVSNTIEQGEVFGVETVYVNASSYAYIVKINDSISFILLGEGKEFQFVQDEEGVQNILIAYYAHQGIVYEEFKVSSGEIQNLIGLGKKFNDSRQPNEAECNRFIGTDAFPCDDRESCLKSCYTPVSHNMCLGVGWPFVDAIALLQNDSRNMSLAYENYSLNIQLIKENDLNDPAYLGAIASIHKMRESAVSLWYNPLFGKYQYNFCHRIGHEFAAIRAAENNITIMRERLLPFIQLNETSKMLAFEARRRTAVMEANLARESCAELKKTVFTARMRLYNNISALEREHTDLNEKMNFVTLLGKKIEDECERNFTQANATAQYFFSQAEELQREYNEAIALVKEVEEMKARCKTLCPSQQASERLTTINSELSKTDNKQLSAYKNELLNLTASLEKAGGCSSLQKLLPCTSALPIILIIGAVFVSRR